MQSYRNLKVWQKAHGLALSIYKLSAKFPKSEMFGMTSQLRRAGISIAANIAEGCARDGDKEFARFLQISQGSAAEVDYYLILAKDLKYIQDKDHKKILSELSEVQRMLSTFIQKLKKAALSS